MSSGSFDFDMILSDAVLKFSRMIAYPQDASGISSRHE
jgi:hypothetical protein